MAELFQKERLQPSLLDRLTDDEPERRQEGPNKRFFSVARLRTVIQRDVSWLLNTCNLETVQDLSEYPEVARSVVNYGISDLTGTNVSGFDGQALERMVKQAIIDFEPRILRNTVTVRAFVDEGQMSPSALKFQIEGELWAHPAPVDIVLQSEIDLENGLVSVQE